MFNGEGGAVTTSIFGKSGKPDLRVYNNIFITNGRTNPAAVSNDLWTDGAGTFTFDNNLWWRVEGGLRFQWANSLVTTWNGWQAMGLDPNGLAADPEVGGRLGSGPAAYYLYPSSPATDRGRVVYDGQRGVGDPETVDELT